MNKTTANLLVLAAFAGAGVALSIACGGKPAETPSATNASATPADTGAPAASTSGAPADTSSASAAASAAPPPLATVLMTDPGAVQKIIDGASSAPAATLKPKGVSGGDALAKGIRDLAKKAASGMEPDGPLATGKMKEKQHLQTDVTLQQGKCYTLVGYSDKVKDLDLYLLAPGVSGISGQDTTDDNKPVIGGPPTPMCPERTTAITYKVDVVADSGEGDVAVQLYSKKAK